MYKYKIQYIFKSEDFYDQLKPQDRKELSFECLKNYYIKFNEFFYEPLLGFQACDKFILECLTNLEGNVFLPGKKIIGKGEHFDHIYFINSGSVWVSDYFDEKPIIEIPRHSFFGDYQVILGTRSNMNYYAGGKDNTILFSLEKEFFLNLIQEN